MWAHASFGSLAMLGLGLPFTVFININYYCMQYRVLYMIRMYFSGPKSVFGDLLRLHNKKKYIYKNSQVGCFPA